MLSDIAAQPLPRSSSALKEINSSSLWLQPPSHFPTSILRVPRKAVKTAKESRSTIPETVENLKELHAPCEFDLLIKTSIDFFPSLCKAVHDHRFVDEAWYRMFRTYDTEAFVFDQFYERLTRYEVDSLVYEYGPIS
ncbi:uncharacterized protein LOC115634781 [Scaptodrosophila lebanonensis]|uniref:Uncharacterized protein LOC115634781 n=1 Tax=Drosophila lebanonensis TaxID=7225 RepID=A0A6J2UJF7_DROLE|nr:uncharacterized protein LOC115634781 [Scaptodrosophila lebanonensis]